MMPVGEVQGVDASYMGKWTIQTIISVPLLILYIVVIFMVFTGFYQIIVNFNSKAQQELISLAADSCEGVTILRPLKGVDSEMELCLESSFTQDYPNDKIEIIFCVQNASDPSIAIVRGLMEKYPEMDSKLLIDSNQLDHDYFGPNPKVNNLHKGYKNAKYDLLWVVDSNVFTPSGVLKKSVYTLHQGLNNGSKNASIIPSKKVKLVTHVPIVLSHSKDSINWGSKLDEMFMSTSHAKFYVALNRIQPAPCVNGKSNLYRRSELDESVQRTNGIQVQPGEGLKHFAKYIGEDNMIGISLWEGVDGCSGMSKDMVYQPIGGQNSVSDYMDRRIRWLRVRKYMVLAATLIEPTTESIISGLIGGYSLNFLVNGKNGIWWSWFSIHMIIWFAIDFIQFKRIQSFEKNVEIVEFCKFWSMREILAFPIWIAAMAGSGIEWRGQQFQILPDLTAERRD